MDNQSCRQLRIIITAFIILSIICTQSMLAAEMTRSEVISATKEGVYVANNIRPDEKESLLKMIDAEIDTSASKILPDKIFASSQDILEAAIKIRLVVHFVQPKYIGLLVRLHIYSIPVRIAYLEKYPPISQECKISLEKNTRELMKRSADVLDKELVGKWPLFSKSEVAAAVSDSERSLLNVIGKRPFSQYLVKPLNKSEIGEIVREFEQRLTANRNEIERRLAVAVRGVKPKDAVIFNAQRNAVIGGILQSIEKVFKRRTSDPKRAKFDPDLVVPNYSKLKREFNSVENEAILLDRINKEGREKMRSSTKPGKNF